MPKASKITGADTPAAKIKKILTRLPSCPGVYEMLNETGETLYVGKAKDLRKRVQSYFRNSAELSPRIRKMLEKTMDLQWTEVSSEVEALILETNLIKEKRPKFNILMRDDKNLAYFCVTLAEDFPRLLLTRRIVKDGSLYFGPKTSASSVRQTIDLLQEIFKFRTTPLTIHEIEPGKVEVKNPGNIKYPCLNYHIGKCSAPCIGAISKAEYRARIDEVIKFLRGDGGEILKNLESKMKAAAAEKEFEKAAHWRDLFLMVQTICEKQIVAAPDEFSADVIGAIEKFDRAFFHVFQIRSGKIINSETFSLALEKEERLTEALFAFLREHAEQVADAPKVLVLSAEIFPEQEQAAWAEFFTRKWGHNVEISLPQKAKRQKLLELAQQNALSYAVRNAANFMKHEVDHAAVLRKLQEKLGMKKLPERIECFDISHLGGTETVASMTVFLSGEAHPKDYRRFALRTIAHGEIDDFKSMREVISRRLKHIPRQLPAEYKLQKITAKNDLTALQKIYKKAKWKFPKPDTVEYLGVKKEAEIRAFLSFTEKDEQEMVQTLWIHPKDVKRNFAYFLLRKLVCTSVAKKIFLPKNLVPNLNTELEELGFELEKDIWVLKNLAQKKKAPESLEALPELIVIDGGKGQLSAANEILQTFPFAAEITICSLAKKFEEVYIPGRSLPLAITKDSPEGQLLQRIRDEAHRFAIGYQGDLHRKKQQKSLLDEIPGIGAKTKQKLLKAFGSVSGIREASDEEVIQVVGEKTCVLLRKNL